jgi:hypothetical protein
MIRKIFTITCLTLAVMFSGCQEQNSSNTAVETENRYNDAKDDPAIIAYYFHRTFRCPTCLAIEADAAGIIEDNFSQQLANGNLMWIPFNLDDSGGDKFEKDFDISVSTLVVARMRDGKVTEFKKLEKIWQLVGDNQAFSKYVKSEIDGYMNDQ